MLCSEGQTYQFFVRATDRGNPPLHTDVPVKVYIMDVIDEPPAFQRTDESFLVPEDTILGTLIDPLSHHFDVIGVINTCSDYTKRNKVI